MRANRKERELTKAQEKDKLKSPWMYCYPEYFRVPLGMLCLRVTEPIWDVGRRSWTDGKRQRVEKCLNKFMAVMAKAAVRDLKWKIEREREAREQKERERRAEERRKLRRAGERKLWALLTESTNWRQSQCIREYVRAAKERAVKITMSAQEDQALNDWIAWALQQADSLDPLAPRSYCTREDRWGKSSTYKEGESNLQAMELVWERMLRRSRYFESRSDRWLES